MLLAAVGVLYCTPSMFDPWLEGTPQKCVRSKVPLKCRVLVLLVSWPVMVASSWKPQEEG